MNGISNARAGFAHALTLVLCLNTTAAIAQKAVLVRDVDRTGGNTQVYSCQQNSGVPLQCILRAGPFTSPPGPKFVADYVSYSLFYCITCGTPTKILNLSIVCGPGCQDYLPLASEVVDGGIAYVSWGGPVKLVWDPNNIVSVGGQSSGPPPIQLYVRVIGHHEFP